MSRARPILAALFVLAGALHFVRPKVYISMMPAWIPRHREAVAVSGAAEIAGGLAMLPDSTVGPGSWWLIALLAAVFPANLHMAIDPKLSAALAERGIPRWALWARLPLQPLLMLAVWRAGRSG